MARSAAMWAPQGNQRAQALQQQGLQNIFGGLKFLANENQREEALKRESGKELFKIQTALAKEGYTINKDTQLQMEDAVKRGDYGGLSGIVSEIQSDERFVSDKLRNKRQEASEDRKYKKESRALGMEKTKSEIMKNITDKSNKISDDLNKLTTGLRQEIGGLGVTKDLAKVSAAFGKVKSAYKTGTPASDIGMIFNIMKVFDPGSTVREGEFATAQNATHVPGQLRAKFNQLKQGTRLTSEQRKDFFETAMGQARAQYDVYQAYISPQVSAAKASGVSLDKILPGFDPSLKSAQMAPQAQQNVQLTPDARAGLLELYKQQQQQQQPRPQSQPQIMSNQFRGR